MDRGAARLSADSRSVQCPSHCLLTLPPSLSNSAHTGPDDRRFDRQDRLVSSPTRPGAVLGSSISLPSQVIRSSSGTAGEGLVCSPLDGVLYIEPVPESDDAIATAASALRAVILAGEHYRQVVATHLGLDVTQTQALSYLYSQGDLGQVELGGLLGYNTSSITALVDRLERTGIACRVKHPTDRRRSIVRLSDRGHQVMRDLDVTFRRAFDHLDEGVLVSLTAAMSSVAVDLRSVSADLSLMPPAGL